MEEKPKHDWKKIGTEIRNKLKRCARPSKKQHYGASSPWRKDIMLNPSKTRSARYE